MSVENSSQYGEQLARVEDLDSDLVCARGFHLDILEFEWLACTPAYGRFALDDLSCSFRHYSSDLDKGVKVSRAVAPSDSFFCKYILPCVSGASGPSPDVLSQCPSKTYTTSV